MLKSLVDWEMSRKEPRKKSETGQILAEEINGKESVEMKGTEGVPDNFEKIKAHKSTLEAAISEVNGFFFQIT